MKTKPYSWVGNGNSFSSPINHCSDYKSEACLWIVCLYTSLYSSSAAVIAFHMKSEKVETWQKHFSWVILQDQILA